MAGDTMKVRWAAVVAAMASMGSTAYAQSSITLYGAVDSGLLYQSTSAASFSAAAKNRGSQFRVKDAGIYSSHFGIKGTEDIGAGYRVNFRLQGSFETTNGRLGLSDSAGQRALFNQFATVGISGPFGSVNVGRQVVPMAWALVETDVRGGQWFGSILTAWLGVNQAAGWTGSSTNGPIGALYDSNAIVYESPSFGGVKASLEYAPGGQPGSLKAGTRESAVLKYSGYGLRLAAVYYNGRDTNPAPNSVATGISNNRMVYVGALYTIQDFSISASYTKGKNPARPNQVNIDMYAAGLGYRFSPTFKITSGVYHLKDANHSANSSTQVAAGAEHSLSKATLVYGQLGYVNNKGTMTQTIAYGQPVAPGVATTAVMLGLRHTF
jgi:predicted porin